MEFSSIGLRNSYRLQISQLKAALTINPRVLRKRAEPHMDLQSAIRLNGPRWQIARVGALVFLVLACGLLAVSLFGKSHGSIEKRPELTRALR